MSVGAALLILMVAVATDAQAQQLGSWRMTGSLTTWEGPDNGGWVEYGPTATLLKNGNVLVVGGNGVELYDPETGRWTLTGNLITPRYGHIAVRLANGKVLVAGGYDPPLLNIGKRTLTSAEIYDPATGAWSPAGNLNVPREGHTAHLLADGAVLVIGGLNTVGANWILENSAEIYDPLTGEWSSAGTIPTAHHGHASTVLANGNVLVIGGIGIGRGSREATLFDLATHTWTATGNLRTPRSNPRATLLPNGKVLVTGGTDQSGPGNSQGVYPALDTAELYDPVTGQWSSTGSMTEGRAIHTQILLPNGKVLVAGGHMGNRGRSFYDPNFDSLIAVSDTAEFYDPATGRWSSTGTMNAPRYGHRATVLANGKVLVAGGWIFGVSRNGAELYDDESPLLTLTSPSYCIGASWELRVQSLSPNAWIRLAGTSNGKPWELLNWRKTDDNGNYSETAVFAPGSEGGYTLYVDVDGRASNEVAFSVIRCEIQLTLNANEYCTGDLWNLKITSDFSNAWMNLSGTSNNAPWEIANWRRTGTDGSFTEAGTFVPGSEGSHSMRVRIGAAQSNLFSFRVSRCGP